MKALITGASSGIGREFAMIFAREGYDLVLVARKEDRLLELKLAIESAHFVQVDLVIEDLSVDGAAQRIFNLVLDRKIDVLVNNAGTGDFGFFVESDLERSTRMVHLNIVALTELTRLFLPGLVERHSGHVLNVASIAAFVPGPNMSVYYASKAYVVSFSAALANELQGTGVTVTTLCPGPTHTEFDRAAGTDWGETYRKHLPTGKQVAEYGYHAMKSGKQIAIYGFANRLMVFLARFLPSQVLASVVRKWN